jgi:hypothetical protein
MSFEQRAAELRANTINTNRVNVSNADIYNELLLQNAESPSGGSATAENQVTQIDNQDEQITLQETANGSLNSIDSKSSTQIEKLDSIIAKQDAQIEKQGEQIDVFNASTNGGVLIDLFGTIVLTTTFETLAINTCKSVTLINLSTNNNVLYKLVSIADIFILEPGYSVKINTFESNSIEVKQATSTGQVLQYIVTQ